jgi:hypothetical protein
MPCFSVDYGPASRHRIYAHNVNYVNFAPNKQDTEKQTTDTSLQLQALRAMTAAVTGPQPELNEIEMEMNREMTAERLRI